MCQTQVSFLLGSGVWDKGYVVSSQVLPILILVPFISYFLLQIFRALITAQHWHIFLHYQPMSNETKISFPQEWRAISKSILLAKPITLENHMTIIV